MSWTENEVAAIAGPHPELPNMHPHIHYVTIKEQPIRMDGKIIQFSTASDAQHAARILARHGSKRQ